MWMNTIIIISIIIYRAEPKYKKKSFYFDIFVFFFFFSIFEYQNIRMFFFIRYNIIVVIMIVVFVIWQLSFEFFFLATKFFIYHSHQRRRSSSKTLCVQSYRWCLMDVCLFVCFWLCVFDGVENKSSLCLNVWIDRMIFVCSTAKLSFFFSWFFFLRKRHHWWWSIIFDWLIDLIGFDSIHQNKKKQNIRIRHIFTQIDPVLCNKWSEIDTIDPESNKKNIDSGTSFVCVCSDKKNRKSSLYLRTTRIIESGGRKKSLQF